MAFNLETFDKLSGESIESVRTIWGYTSATDSVATITASSYFNDLRGSLVIGDRFMLNGSDGLAAYDVTAVLPNVTMEDSATSGVVGPGSFTTLQATGATHLTNTLKIGVTTTSVNTILDEDSMSSDSPTALATQQSIKAYVDAQGHSPLTTKGDLFTYSTVNDRLAAGGTNGQLLQVDSTASTGLAWSTATYPATTTTNELLYSGLTNLVVGIPSAANSVLMSTGAEIPIWTTTLPSAVQSNITTTGTIASGTWNGTDIALADGGTGASLTADEGGLIYSDASGMAVLASTATPGQIPVSGASAAPAWSTATYPSTTTANQLIYSSATNTLTGLATGNDGVLITSAAGVPSVSSTIPLATQNNITKVGTVTAGGWNGSLITGTYGGTGTNNGASTIKYDANVVFGGAYTFDATLTAATSVTFPTSGILATGVSNTSWAVVMGDGTNDFTTSFANGYYQRINELVFFQLVIVWTGKGSATAGSAIQVSLPIATKSSNPNRSTFTVGWLQGATLTGMVLANAATSASQISLSDTPGSSSALLVSDFGTSGEIQISGHYMA